MASVTQTQRDKLTELFNKKLTKLEEAIRSTRGPELKILSQQAKDLAIESLGLKELNTECVEKLKVISTYTQQVKELQETMDQFLDKPDTYYRRHYGNLDDSLSCYAAEQVGLRQMHHRRILLSETTFGAKLNRIEELRENMEEQVMRATSSKEIQTVMDDFDQVFKQLVSMD